MKTKSMQCKWTESYVLVFVLLSASAGSHSLWLLSIYIQGKTQFPEFSCTTSLDDITVGYYNSETYFARGNMTNEEDVMNSDYIKGISGYMYNSFLRRSELLGKGRQNDNLEVYQTLVFCELLDLDKPGQMIIRDAARGSTTDELHYFNNKFTYKVILNITQDEIKPHLEEFKQEVENTFYPVCITTLKKYLKKRENQINRKMKPQVRFFQKANSDSGGFRVSCLATGFYPRHINLTLFRDGQPVSDQEITGGDLLPNGDGTYQMRKSLEISADEHKYTCSATHISLDNKLDPTLEFDPGFPFKSVILPVLIVLAQMLMIGTGVVIYKYWRRRAGVTRTKMNGESSVPSSNCDYSAASNSEENMEPAS
ncbi:major histocompatibility complex class I-related gene protein-like isoform X9 [Ctenopharyngodon idella]|uniref:major histocompatibility complex class I-related gene protein-like isoform X9 n=1 Tax=Ctenopharyngodon idella TaxID=7959 RepID=UPI00222FBF50|nr:major histocompatibility complex class I-related gene protein-like isoform X9 [Ctenopharyngodon idella]